MRQPGSSFKPFVYSAALDNGYTPSSVIMDAPVEINQGAGLDTWRPENYGNKFYGPQTLRFGIEYSRNVMTVRLAQDMGMPLIAEYARRFGIYDDLPPYLSMALGAGETTVLRLATGYGMLANGGRKLKPTLIDRIQDRWGHTIYKHDERHLRGLRRRRLEEPGRAQARRHRRAGARPDDRLPDHLDDGRRRPARHGDRRQGASTSRSPARPARPMTRRTPGSSGYSPDLLAGLYIGYDKPRPLGKGATGGHLAAPIFADFMKVALADKAPVPFRVPPGIKLIRIDRKSGMRAGGDGAGTILEAFKPGTAPPDSYSIIGASGGGGLSVSPRPTGR